MPSGCLRSRFCRQIVASLTSNPQRPKCLITGATSGIGRATACELSCAGCDLVLLGRREDEGRRLASSLSRRPGSGLVEFVRIDLSDQNQVRSVAAKLAAAHTHFDVLINNAGARFNNFQLSPDGIELTFATNHIGHFLLTHLLIKLLLKGHRSKIIVVGSGAHGGLSAQGDWCLTRENYDRKLAYGKSKLANIMFSQELARRLAGTGVVSNAVDPGGVATNLGRNNGLFSWFRHLAYYALKGELLSPRRAAETLVFLAQDPLVDGISGKYFYRKREIESSLASRDLAAAEKLWALSTQLTGLSANEEFILSGLGPTVRALAHTSPACPPIDGAKNLAT